MPMLRFLSSALAKGVTGYKQGQLDKQRLETTAANTAEDRATKRKHESALEAFQQQQIDLKRSEMLDREATRAQQEARDQQTAEKQRLEIDRLRHPGKYREPSYGDSQKAEAMKYRDLLLTTGVPIAQANEEMKKRFPLVSSGFDAMDSYINSRLPQQ